MRIVALMPARNEDWVLGLSARVALTWCDAIAILDHASTDRTPQIIRELSAEYGPRVASFRVESPAWDEMQHRQRLLDFARAVLDPSHIALIDADELLTANLVDTIRVDVCELCTSRPGVLRLPGYNLRDGLEYYHSSGVWGNRWFSAAFYDLPMLGWVGDRFHHREPMGARLVPYQPVKQGQGGVLHLWGANRRRLVAKHCWYAMMERCRWPNKPAAAINAVYQLAIRGKAGDTPAEWKYQSAAKGWMAPYARWMDRLRLCAEPWQEAECRAMMVTHGAKAFEGLDLYGFGSW